MRIVSLAFLLIENCAYDTIYSVCEFVEIAKGFVLDRDKSFDILKGIGIVAVVLGHFIEPFRANHFVFKGIFVLIYSFHMPLFFIVSGTVIRKHQHAYDWNHWNDSNAGIDYL